MSNSRWITCSSMTARVENVQREKHRINDGRKEDTEDSRKLSIKWNSHGSARRRCMHDCALCFCMHGRALDICIRLCDPYLHPQGSAFRPNLSICVQWRSWTLEKKLLRGSDDIGSERGVLIEEKTLQEMWTTLMEHDVIGEEEDLLGEWGMGEMRRIHRRRREEGRRSRKSQNPSQWPGKSDSVSILECMRRVGGAGADIHQRDCDKEGLDQLHQEDLDTYTNAGRWSSWISWSRVMCKLSRYDGRDPFLCHLSYWSTFDCEDRCQRYETRAGCVHVGTRVDVCERLLFQLLHMIEVAWTDE